MVVQRMRPIHQHLGLDNGHQPRFLAQRRIAGQRMGVGVLAILAGDGVAYGDHRPPFGEARTQRVIFVQSVAQAVQPLGDLLARRAGQRMGAGVHLDAGYGARRLDNIDHRRAVGGALADGLVE